MNTRFSLLASLIEKAINKALEYDPGTQAALEALQGKVLQVHCTKPDSQWFAHIHTDSVSIYNHYETPADCKITGSLSALIGLGFSEVSSLANTDVYIEGNPGVLTHVQTLLKNLDIDWELALSEYLGTVPAHFLAQLIHSKEQWIRTRGQALPGYLASYFTEEAKLLPTEHEVRAHYQGIQSLRSQVSRLEARMAGLRKKLDPPTIRPQEPR